MKLTWSELKDSIQPLNLWNFPSWEVLQTRGTTMKTIELTEEEIRAFRAIYITEQLSEYLSYSESGKLFKDEFSSLFVKLGINVKGEEDV